MASTQVKYKQIIGAPVNVRDKGAKGDGATDDTAAIQAAVTEALASNRSVFVPAGTYKVTGTINCVQDATHAVLIEGESYIGAVFATYLTGSTPLFSFAGSVAEPVRVFYKSAGVRRLSVRAQNAGAVGARNSGSAVLSSGVCGLELDYFAVNMTNALHLHNNLAGSYTEEVRFNVWSEYCDNAIKFQVTAGNTSFHGCGGYLRTDIWDGQCGIFVGTGAYWYNFDLRVDAIGHANAGGNPKLIFLEGNCQVAKGRAVLHGEEQNAGGAGYGSLTMATDGSGKWSVDTVVEIQGGNGALAGNAALLNGHFVSDQGGLGMHSGIIAARNSVAKDATITLGAALSGGLLLVRDGSAGQTSLLMFDGATPAITELSDPSNKTTAGGANPGTGSNTFWIHWSGTALLLTNYFAGTKLIDTSVLALG